MTNPFRRIPGATNFYARVAKVEIGMPHGIAEGEAALCTPAVGGVRVKFAKREKPRLYGNLVFWEYFRVV